MKLWEPKRCCCCASPRTGSLVLGYLGVIFSVLGILGIAQAALVGKRDIINQCLKRNPDEDPEHCWKQVSTGMMVGSSIEILRAVFCILLLLGVHKKRTPLMIPYMVANALLIVLLILGFIGGAVASGYFNLWILSLTILVIGTFIIFFLTYLLLVVRVQYKMTKEEVRQGNRGIEFTSIPQRSEAPPHY